MPIDSKLIQAAHQATADRIAKEAQASRTGADAQRVRARASQEDADRALGYAARLDAEADALEMAERVFRSLPTPEAQ